MTVATPELVLRSLDASWSYARWEQLPDDGNRYEVIDGVLYMTTAPSFFHQWVVQRLVRLVGIPAEDQGLAYCVTAPVGVLMPGCEPVQPDFLLVRRGRSGIIHDRRVRGTPDLIVEVLSPSNPEQDLDTKRSAYARAGVPEYWIVRPETRDALVFGSPTPTRVSTRRSGTFRRMRCWRRRRCRCAWRSRICSRVRQIRPCRVVMLCLPRV